jgi:hypothetical protein
MPEGLEIVVWDASARRAVIGAMRGMPVTRVVPEPSHNGTRRIVVARLAELESAGGRQRLDMVLGGNRGRAACAAAVFLLNNAKSGRRWSTNAFRAWNSLASVLRDRLLLTADRQTVARLVFARRVKAEDQLVAMAQVEGDKLVAWSCRPKRYEAPVSDIPALAALSPRERERFEISSSGSRIHWPAGDVDLDVECVRERSDPEFRKEREAQARAEVAHYAAAIRETRLAHGLTQKDIPRLSERQLRRVEQGECFPQLATLEALARAHGMTVKAYLAELARRDSLIARRSCRR